MVLDLFGPVTEILHEEFSKKLPATQFESRCKMQRCKRNIRYKQVLCESLTVLFACSVGIPLKTASSAMFFSSLPKSGKPITSVIVVGKTERDRKEIYREESVIVMVAPDDTSYNSQLQKNLHDCCLNFLKVSIFCS